MKDPALKPVHPGEVLSEDFLKPLAVSQYRLAKDIGVPPRRINEIILGKRGVTADTALRLAHYLGTSPAVWMNLQARYELDRKSLVLSKLIARLPRLAATLA
jgi:addiction module HigA family antidote